PLKGHCLAQLNFGGNLESDEVGREFWEPSEVPVSLAELDEQALVLDPAALAQAWPEGLPQTSFRRGRGLVGPDTDAVQRARLRRLGGEWSDDHGNHEKTDKIDRPEPHGRLLWHAHGNGGNARLRRPSGSRSFRASVTKVTPFS